MKRFIRFLGCIPLILVSCSTVEMKNENGVGELRLRMEASYDNVQVPVRSEQPEIDVNEFNVEIYNSSGVRLYNKPYSEASQSAIKLNAGDYTLVASYGDSLGVGFDAIYFGAKEPFTVRPQTSETLDVVCRQANVKAEVGYGQYILSEHPDIYSKLVRDNEHILTFENGETRAGYIPGGMLVLQVYAKINDSLKMFRTDPIECFPNDYVRFNVESTGVEDAGITVNIKIDGSTVDREYNQTIPVSMIPDESPAVKVSGFGESKIISVPEGLKTQEAYIQVYAPAGISECVLNVRSSALLGMGVPESVDLTTPDPEVMDVLSDVGLFVSSDVSDKYFAYINFSGFTERMKTVEGDNSSVFSINVRDKKGRYVESEYYGYEIVPVVLHMNELAAGDVWATSVRNLKVSAEYTHMKVSLQQSTDGGVNWTDLKATPSLAGDGTYTLASLSGLNPGTDYQVRAIYNGNEHTASDPVSFRTEDALQLGNSGFEEFKEVMLTVKTWFSSAQRKLFYPYVDGGERWWDVNSRKTMPSSTTPSNLNYKCTPTVVPSSGAHSGEKAVQVSTISVDDYNIASTSLGTPVAGELFIGTSDDNGNHSSEGHAFTSRPLSMSFWYKFAPYGTESFYAMVRVFSSDGRVIGEGVVDNMGTQPEWRQHRCDIVYSDTQSKASSIYVIFKSSSSSSPGINKDQPYPFYGEKGVRAHLGSMLTIDDVLLNY